MRWKEREKKGGKKERKKKKKKRKQETRGQSRGRTLSAKRKKNPKNLCSFLYNIIPRPHIMAKKRKASSAAAAKDNVPVDDSNKRTRMRIKTYEDVAGSDDEFHINRDKIMLDDGPEAKRRRRED
jgi:hypothetical protein